MNHENLRRTAPMKSIEEEWNGFSGMIFAKMKPTPIQVEEMKRAFFAGYWACFCGMKRLGEDDIHEDTAINFMQDREDEGQEFYRDLIARHAESN